jgi:uncharacterized protein (TIGR02231 family)
VAARFSTAQPDRQRTPGEAVPDPARVIPEPPPASLDAPLGARVMEETMPAMEPVANMDQGARMVTEGLAIRYDYAAPVTVGPTGRVTLPLDALSFDMMLENRAVPRRDATAFLVTTGENDSGEPILPGPARFYRDGALVGSGGLPTIPDGAEMEMAFGALDHLPLVWQDLSRDAGTRGVFVAETEERRRILFGVRNLSDAPETVRLLYALPFSEQEELDVTVSLSVAPDARDADDLRGVAAWSLEVAPGAEARIEMEVEMRWPEDMILDWQP